MSEITLYSDLASRRLTRYDGSAFELPALVLGDRFTVSHHILERVRTSFVERNFGIRNVKVSMGEVMAPPIGGSFKLKLEHGGEWATSGAIGCDVTANQLQTAIASMLTTAGASVSSVSNPAPSCWVLRITPAEGEADPATLQVADNTLEPECFVRVRVFEQAGKHYHEVRLMRAPLVFTDSHALVLPKAPSVTRVRLGAIEGTVKISELQAFHLPEDFRGSYYIKFGFETSRVLSYNDGPDELADALNGMFADGKTRFVVTIPEANIGHIEFVGPLKGSTYNLLEPVVSTTPPGVLTYTLDLRTANLATAPRAEAEIKVPFEVEAEIVKEGEDADDPDVTSSWVTLFQETVTLRREQIFDELSTTQEIDWLEPAQPKTYIPFDPSQVITGQQHRVGVLGDGETLSFVITHNFGTRAMHEAFQENETPGRKLSPTEYEFTFLSDDAVQVDFAAPPAEDGIAYTLTTAGPKSAFVNDLEIEIGQVDGLQELLDLLAERLTTVEDKLPYTTPAALADGTFEMEMTIADRFGSFPGRYAATFVPSSTPTEPLKPGALLPAIHKADGDVIAVPETLPAAASSAGVIYANTGTYARTLLAGGFGHKTARLTAADFIGCDGRMWAPYVLPDAAKNSYYPRAFEVPLFLLAFNDKQLRPGGLIEGEFKLGFRAMKATSHVQWLLVVEAGSVPQQSTPSPVGVNLSDISWNAAPIIAQRVTIGDTLEEGAFGFSIARSIADVLTANRTLYGATELATSAAPTSANFVLRGKLTQLDTENSPVLPVGTVYFALQGGKVKIS